MLRRELKEVFLTMIFVFRFSLGVQVVDLTTERGHIWEVFSRGAHTFSACKLLLK